MITYQNAAVTLSALITTVAHLEPGELAQLAELPADDAPALATLTALTLAAMYHTDILQGVGGSRVEPLKTMTRCFVPSPFAFAAEFMGTSRHALAKRLGLTRGVATWLWSRHWRGVEHVEALAGLGGALAEFLEEHERGRRAA